ncbi:hypothetical protein ACHAQE_005481 [Botrytis cinerea]
MEAINTSHDISLSYEGLIRNDSNRNLPGSPISPSSIGDDSNQGGLTAELLVKTMKENNLDELRRLLNSKVNLLAMLIATRVIYDASEIFLNLSLIQFAAAFSGPSIINLLLEYGAQVDEEIPTIGGTALHLASQYGSKYNIDVLLSQKPNMNQKDRDGTTPLHLASRYGREENVVRLLDAGADYSQLNYSNSTAFHNAAMYGHLEILQLLYERGSQRYINEANVFFNAPLHLASLNGHVNIAEWLLQKGAAVNQPGMGGATSLYIASDKGHIEIVRELLKYAVDIHKRNVESYSPILIASENAQLEIFDLLSFAGASLSDTGARDNGTCYHRVVMGFRKFSIDHEKIIEKLVGRGIDIDQVNANGLSPLFLACIKQKLENAECLLHYGANVNQMGPRKNATPLMEACCLPDSRIVELLLQHKADTKISSSHGMTALAYAVDRNRLGNVKLLIKYGANVICSNPKGTTLLQSAVIHTKNIEIALEILAAEPYYPKSLSAKYPYIESTSEIREIEIELLQGFGGSKYETLEQLHIIMYWAVSNGAVDLAIKCIEHNQQVLQWSREKGTWLHIASKAGMVEMVQLLLERMRMQSDVPDQPLGWAAVALIMQQNNQRDSSLVIALKQGHDQLEELFWSRIEQLQTTDESFIDSYPDIADYVLEFLARYEESGNEKILKGFLISGDKRGFKDWESFTTLQWAVCRSQAVVVWWLLSKGGYTIGEINSALKLIITTTDKQSEVIQKLLQNPPPTLDHISNPNKKHTRKFQNFANSNPVMNFQGSIVDILSGAESKRIAYANPSVKDLIYKSGPDSIMRRKGGDLSQRELDFLKKGLNKDNRQPSSNFGIHKQTSPDPANLTSSHYEKPYNEEFSSGSPNEFDLRWIHLPVNELHLMRRDNDQVLSKFLQKKSGNFKGTAFLSKQEWKNRWCLKLTLTRKQKNTDETIITATTQDFGKTSNQSSKEDREPPESLLQNALDNILYGETKSQFERARTVDSLMELLLGVASGLFIKRFVPISEKIYKGPIEIFRESIRDVAEKESSLFQEFLGGLQKAKSGEPKQKNGQPSGENPDSKSPDGPMRLNRYHVISSEAELLNMIRDIRDELHMLRSLAVDQEIVWKQAFASSDLMHFKAYTPTNVKKDLNAMLSEVDKTEDYVSKIQWIVEVEILADTNKDQQSAQPTTSGIGQITSIRFSQTV